MAEYSVKCPKCGNWVVGKIKRSTLSKGIRGAVKSGGMKGVLTAAGSVVPGFGNVAGLVTGAIIDAIYGDEIKEMVDGAADKIMEDSTYSFDCPGCGHHWKMEEKEILKMIANENKSSEKKQSMFDKYWDYFLEHSTEICETRESLNNFLTQIDIDMPQLKQNQSNSEYSALEYLKSWAILIFLEDNGQDEELLDLGSTAIHWCNYGTGGDSEYMFMRAIYEMMSVPVNEPGAFGTCNKIFQDNSSALFIKDSLLKPEALQEYMNTFYYRKLSDIVSVIESKKNYQQALKVYKKMTKIDFYDAKIEGFGRLSQYYRYDNFKGIENNLEKAFEYAKKCLDLIDPEAVKSYNPENWFENLLMDNLSFAALGYSVESGSDYNPDKAYKLAQIGYKLGDGYSTYLMGLFAEEGIGTEKNKLMSSKYYKEAVERGCKEAKDALKKQERKPVSNDDYRSLRYKDSVYYYLGCSLLEDYPDQLNNATLAKILSLVGYDIGITIDSNIFSSLKTSEIFDTLWKYIVKESPDVNWHALIRKQPHGSPFVEFELDAYDGVIVEKLGAAVIGVVSAGTLAVGDNVVMKDDDGNTFESKVSWIETNGANYGTDLIFQNEASAGDCVGIGLDLKLDEIPDWFHLVDSMTKQAHVERGNSTTLSFSEEEQEYIDTLKEFLSDSEISERERKMLDRIRKAFGISEKRAAELEASLKPQLTEDEQEYVEMYREYIEKGEITEKERRRLDKFAAALGISEERIKEIEAR